MFRASSLLLLLFLSLQNVLTAEIEMIVLRWNAAICRDMCIPQLSRQLGAISSVTDFQINAQSGTAIAKWKPHAPFSFVPFNQAFRGTGIRLLDIRLRVKGTLAFDGYNYYIDSLGDNTRFILIGPTEPSMANYQIQQNIATHSIPDVLRIQLDEAIEKHQTAIIEGPLFQPTRMILILIIEQFKVERKSKDISQ